jgi:phosphoglycolate phosphatase
LSDLRLVVFDVDGTLVDSQHVILAAMRLAFEGAGRAPPPDRAVLDIVGLSLPEAIADLAPGLSAVARAELVARYRENSAAQRSAAGRLPAAPLYPGVREGLDRLGTDTTLLMGVATGKARTGLDHVFGSHGIGRYFVTMQTADLHPSKPHPSMLLAALAETECGPARAIMVGDTVFDIAMGRAAGFRTIGVGWGYHPPDRLRAAGADRVVERFDELDAALTDFWSTPA